MATMWIDERVEFLKKASRITEEQKLLIALYDEREFLTAIQKRKFDFLKSDGKLNLAFGIDTFDII